MQSKAICVDFWGDLALFTRPESKVERLTYPVPPPSAARGMLSAIYSKPNEFYWQITKIEILEPIKYLSVKRNEVKKKVAKSPILVEDARTQRNSLFLRNVRYRITAVIVKREEFPNSIESLYEQAIRRIRSGKCFFQPALGTRECAAYFEESDKSREPIDFTMDLGYILYDVFDLHKYKVTKKTEPYVTLFHAFVDHGVLEVPDFDSADVIRAEGVLC